MATKKTNKKQEPTKPILSEQQIAQAATNDPALSPNEFKIGDKVFKLIDLSYDDYLKFVGLLKPFFSKLFGDNSHATLPDITIAPKAGLSLEGILEYCAKDLPELACIVCRQTHPDIDVEWLKKNSNPIKLANVVLAQLVHNNIITDFADFFIQALPLMKLMK